MSANVKILFGKNSNEFGEDLLTYLECEGFETILCENDGEKLFEMIALHEPNFVLCDSILSTFDAAELISKSEEFGKKKPFFIIGECCRNAYIEKQIMPYTNAYIILSPFDEEAIISIINHVNNSSLTNFESTDNNSHIEIVVTEIIHQIGIPAHIKGYHYLRKAIMLSILDADILESVTKRLYPTVAKNFDTSPSRVERAIRHAIEIAWDRGDVEVLTNMFGYTINGGKGKPTNSEFIALITDNLRLRFKMTNKTAALV